MKYVIQEREINRRLTNIYQYILADKFHNYNFYTLYTEILAATVQNVIWKLTQWEISFNEVKVYYSPFCKQFYSVEQYRLNIAEIYRRVDY